MPRAAIFGLAGTELGAEEAAFLRDADPWGAILFARNVATPAQLRRLTGALREALGRDAPVLIDQEGGRVARLRPPHWRGWAPVAADAAAGEEALALRYRLIAAELRAVGIDVNCMPLLDLAVPGADPIIGDRALGGDAATVAARGRAVCDALLAGGVLPVIKHLPGHGRAPCDSHLALPVVDVPREVLETTDFAPFRALADQALGMTAHVVYAALDPDRPATTSPACIAAIRRGIGFDGLLMSDDLSMAALAGPMRARARDALAAGCDMLLHCNADRAEMETVAAEAPMLDAAPARRAARAEATRRAPAPFDAEAAVARHAALTGVAA